MTERANHSGGLQNCKAIHDLEFGIAGIHKVSIGPPLMLVRFPLDGILYLQHANSIIQIGVFRKLAESPFNPTVHAVDKDVKLTRGAPFINACLHLDIES